MRILENASDSRKVCVWKDEMPISYVGKKSFCKSIASGGVDWYAGTLCIEAKLYPRHVSNYAMICMRYTPRDIREAELIIYSGERQMCFESNALPLKSEYM